MKKLVLVITLVLGALSIQAQSIFTDEKGVAIKGYDVVAYFVQNKAVKGTEKFSAKHDGVTFHFANEGNKKKFVASPEKYLPKYGGYCAYAVGAMNSKVPVNPETFKLVDGELYLFFNDLYEGKPMNTIEPWNADEAALKSKADANWKELADK
ncbi:MAG: YHS domain-containing protein [Cytophagales bacterium]|nr:YHS domain-containing protein [Cytophagales bacterium]